MAESNNRIYDKLDIIDRRQDDQAITLVRLTGTVEEHVRRTNALEIALKEEIMPVVLKTKTALLLFSWIGGLVGFIGAVKAFLF